jgi:ornithine cyclodeaminase
MLTLSNADIRALLPMTGAIDLVAKAMGVASAGRATLPLRHAMPLDVPNLLGIMPGAMQEPACFGTKLISLYPNNPAKGYSSHLGLMVLFERDHGTPMAIMDAGLLTAIRTAAASAVASRILARADASVLAIIGTGEQAQHHIEAICAVRPIAKVRIAGRTAERGKVFADKMAEKYPQLDIQAAQNIRDAVLDADIVCTVTSARDTVLCGDWIRQGTHVNAVGASVPSLREIDENLLVKSGLFVDYRPSALAQARDIIEALANGVITKDHILGEIGEVLNGSVTGRKDAEQVTLYRSMGIAAQDLVCAYHVAEQAKIRGLGISVSIF